MRALRLALPQYKQCPYKKRTFGPQRKAQVNGGQGVRTEQEGGCLQAQERDLRGN